MGSSSPDDEVENTKASRDLILCSAEAAMEGKLYEIRTKTRCLTCRHRRLECGEQRPVCGNHIKSKRYCDCYSQRGVFKSSQYDYSPVAHGGAHIMSQAGPVSGLPPPY